MRDTLSALRNLEAAGIDPMHAEAIVGVLGKVHEQVATKTDLGVAVATTRTDLENAVAATRIDLENAVAATRTDLGVAVATTKTDLENAVAALRAEFAAALAALEARIEARIERAMNRNLLATIAVGGVIIAAVKLL